MWSTVTLRLLKWWAKAKTQPSDRSNAVFIHPSVLQMQSLQHFIFTKLDQSPPLSRVYQRQSLNSDAYVKLGINSSKCHSLCPQDTFGFKMLMREFGYFAILRQNTFSSSTYKLQCNVWYTGQQRRNYRLDGRQQLDCKNSNLTVSDRYITQQHMQRNKCLQCERKQNIPLLPVCMGGWVQEVQEQREKKEHRTANVFLECYVSLTTKHGCRRAESEKSRGFSPEGQSLSLWDS